MISEGIFDMNHWNFTTRLHGTPLASSFFLVSVGRKPQRVKEHRLYLLLFRGLEGIYVYIYIYILAYFYMNMEFVTIIFKVSEW